MNPEGIPWVESDVTPLEQSEGAVLVGQETLEEQVESIIPEEIYEKLSGARWDEEKLGNQQEELGKSEAYISTLSLVEQQNIFTVMDEAARRNFNNYIKNNGYVINEITLQAFEAEFGIVSESRDASLEEVGTSLEEIDTSLHLSNEEWGESKINTLKESTTAYGALDRLNGNKEVFLTNIEHFSHIPGFYLIVQRLENVDVENPEDVKAIDEALINALDTNFEQVVRVYEELGREENLDNPFASDVFQSFRAQAVSLDSSFESRFVKYEEAPRTLDDIPDDVHEAQIVGGLGTDKFTMYGNIAEASSDGQIIRMDMSNVPPTRSLTLEGSSFSLPTDVPIGDFYSAISNEGLAYEEAENENRPKINVLDALNSSEVQDFLRSDDFEKENLQNCIRIISQMIGLSADMSLSDIIGKDLTNKDDILRAFSSGGILARKTELENEIEEKKVAYEGALKLQVKAYHESLREQDEITRKALQICKNSGFESCDIHHIMSQLSGSIIPQIGVSFDKGNIDLGSLNIGQSLAESGNEKTFAEYIYRFVNTIVFGKPEGQMGENGEQLGFNLAEVRNNPMGQFKTDTEIKQMLEGKGVISTVTGTANRSTIISRLKGGEQE